MSNVLPFARRRLSKEGQGQPVHNDCRHRHLRLNQNGGIVICADCDAMLTPFWALSMLSTQYALALAQIERLKARLSLADARIIELSDELDTFFHPERASKQTPTKT